jgi:hypothetical protein
MWKKLVDEKGDFVEKKNLNFVKNVAMIYANFITITVSQINIRHFLSYLHARAQFDSNLFQY